MTVSRYRVSGYSGVCAPSGSCGYTGGAEIVLNDTSLRYFCNLWANQGAALVLEVLHGRTMSEELLHYINST
jgi:hypothetical protein